MSYNNLNTHLPEDEAFALFKQAMPELSWRAALARKLAQLKRGARGVAAFKDLVTVPWGQAQILPQHDINRKEMM